MSQHATGSDLALAGSDLSVRLTPTIPPRFRKAIVRHAIAASVLEKHSLILAIQGAPGVGKTFQTRLSLEEAGFDVFPLSGAMLSGTFEGEGVKTFREHYVNASGHARTNRHRRHAAIILEDFDLSPAGQVPGVRYTVNSQLLSGVLMNLCDSLESVALSNSSRVPIFLTGNNFTTLSEPLTRPGRVDFFTWVPSLHERFEMIWSAVQDHMDGGDTTRSAVMKLATSYEKESVASFAAAIQAAVANKIYDEAARHSSVSQDTLRSMASRRWLVSLEDLRLEMDRIVRSRSEKTSYLASRKR